MKLMYSTLLLSLLAIPLTAIAETEDQALARQLANPLAKLIQIPIDFSFDTGMGSDGEGERMLLN